MKPILSHELTHCFKHAHTHRNDVECWGCTIDRRAREIANAHMREQYPHANWVTMSQLMKALQETHE